MPKKNLLDDGMTHDGVVTPEPGAIILPKRNLTKIKENNGIKMTREKSGGASQVLASHIASNKMSAITAPHA